MSTEQFTSAHSEDHDHDRDRDCDHDFGFDHGLGVPSPGSGHPDGAKFSKNATSLILSVQTLIAKYYWSLSTTEVRNSVEETLNEAKSII